MRRTMCDKCGVLIDDDKSYSLLECFTGCLKVDDVDLCDMCFDKLEEHIKIFALDKENAQ